MLSCKGPRSPRPQQLPLPQRHPPRAWRPIERLGDRLPQREGRKRKKKKELTRNIKSALATQITRTGTRTGTANGSGKVPIGTFPLPFAVPVLVPVRVICVASADLIFRVSSFFFFLFLPSRCGSLSPRRSIGRQALGGCRCGSGSCCGRGDRGPLQDNTAVGCWVYRLSGSLR